MAERATPPAIRLAAPVGRTLVARPLPWRGGGAWLAATIVLTAGSAIAAIALAPRAGAPASEGLAFLLFVGSSVHVASTGWFYTVPEVRAHMRQRKSRYYWWPLALLAGAGTTAMLLPRPVLYWLLLPYFGWQFFHYQKQNLGIVALAAAACHLPSLRRSERRALIAAGLSGIAALIARPGLLQLPVEPVPPAVFPLAVAAFCGSVAVGIGCLTARGRARLSAGFMAAYLTSLVFSLPIFVFSSPYAAVAGLPIAHGLQYLLLMGLLAAGGGRRTRMVSLAALVNIALLGGAALALASDQLTSEPAVRVLYGLYLGVVMAHVVVDAGLWRMREVFPRAFLGSRLAWLTPRAAGP